MRKKIQKPDLILLSTLAILCLLGILILVSVSTSFSQEKYGTPSYYFFHQIFFGFLPGIFLGFLAFKIPLDWFKKWSLVLLLGTLFLMFLVFFPKIGISRGGANRWINLGPVSFQPSEFLKLTFIFYLAAFLSKREGIFPKKNLKGKPKAKPSQAPVLIPFLIMISLISLILILQPHMSTMVVIVSIGFLIYFLAETPLWHAILIFLVGGGLATALIKIAPYRLSRLLVFLNPAADPMGVGYQIKQALISTGSGGVGGVGLGLGAQKFGFLPQPMSDSIFAVFAEETGFLGSLILILLFLVFFWRGWKIAKKAEDRFSQLVAAGISFWILIQAFINIGSMIGILPLTGIPLPFLAYGGSALVAELIGVGILLNISRNSNKS